MPAREGRDGRQHKATATTGYDAPDTSIKDTVGVERSAGNEIRWRFMAEDCPSGQARGNRHATGKGQGMFDIKQDTHLWYPSKTTAAGAAA